VITAYNPKLPAALALLVGKAWAESLSV